MLLFDKRKNFNITSDFIFVDDVEQKMYHLNGIVAEDDKVQIYQAYETSIFNVLTNFELNVKTEKPLASNDLSFLPKFEYNFQWDDKRDKPALESYQDVIKYGYGAKAGVQVDLTFKFDNIFDVKLIANVELKAVVGAEVVIEDNTVKEIPGFNAFSKSIPIPAFSKTFKILKFEIETGLFFNFDIDFQNMKLQIPVGFDFYKGFQFFASKYYEITTYSVSGSDWKIDVSKLPEEDSLSDIIKTILSAKFTGEVVVTPSFSFKLNLGEKKFEIKFGVMVPFQYEFGFNTEQCQAPYLYGSLTIPFTGFVDLPEFKVLKCTIFKQTTLEKVFYTLPIGPFCIGLVSQETLQKALPEDEKESTDLESYTCFEKISMIDQTNCVIKFKPNRKMAYLKCTFSKDQVGKYLLFFNPTSHELQFFYEKDRKSFYDGLFYIKVSSTSITIPVQRSNPNSENEITVKCAFFEIPNDNLPTLIPLTSLIINVNPNCLNAFLSPSFNGGVVYTMTPLNVVMNNIKFDSESISYHVDDTYSLVLLKPFGYSSRYNLKLIQNSAQIQSTEPEITLNLDFLKDIIESSYYDNKINFYVFCENADSMIARIPNIKYDITSTKGLLGDKLTYFLFTLKNNELRGNYDLTFKPFCKSNTDLYCYIRFPKKEPDVDTEYYLIKYGNRDGISLTGSGFLSEIFTLSTSSTYIYYKTFKDSLKTVKIQKPKALSVKLEDGKAAYKKISGSVVDPAITNPKRICIYADNSAQIIPFSRKYVTNKMETLYKNGLGFNIVDDDYSQITNDEDGCIVFDSQLLTGEFRYNLPASVTDLNIEIPSTGFNYVCICQEKDACNDCSSGLQTNEVKIENTLSKDPGSGIDIKVFSNSNIRSSIFTNEHNVYVDPNYNLTLQNVDNVDLSDSTKIKFDLLSFSNAENVIIRAGSELNIKLSTLDAGKDFKVSITSSLKLIVKDSSANLLAPTLYVFGEGEVNTFDYPFDKIVAIPDRYRTINLIKGAVLFCNKDADCEECNSNTYDEYKVLNRYEEVNIDMKSNIKYYFLLYTYSSRYLDADINKFSGQSINIGKDPRPSSGNLLSETEDCRLRLLHSTELVAMPYAAQVHGSKGSAYLNLLPSALPKSHVVGFNKKLTLKSKYDHGFNKHTSITLQAQSDKADLVVDDNFKLDSYLFNLETAKENTKVTIYCGNQDLDQVKAMLNASNQIELEIKSGYPKESSGGGVSKGLIIGIVVAVVVVIIIVVVVVVIIIMKKRRNAAAASSNENIEKEADEI